MENRYRRSERSKWKFWDLSDFEFKKLVQLFLYAFLGLATVVIGIYLTSGHLVNPLLTDQFILNYRHALKVGALLSSMILAVYLSKDIKRSFFIKFGFSYLIYWSVSYFLLMTQNINNISFDFSDVKTNHFFEIGPWKFVLVLLVVSSILNWWATKYPKMGSLLLKVTPETKTNLGLSLLMALVVLRDNKLLANLMQYLYLEEFEMFLPYFNTLLYKIVLIVGTVTLITYLFWRAIDGVRQNKSTLSLAMVTSVTLALVFNYLIQYSIKSDTDYLGDFIFPGATLFQIIVLTLLNVSVYSLFNRYWLSSLIIIFTGTAFTIANQTKFIMRSEPILWTDLSMLSQFNVIASFVDQKLWLLALGLFLSLTIIYLFLKKKYLKGKIFQVLWKRLALMVAVVMSFWSIFTFFANQETVTYIPALSRLNAHRNIDFEGHARRARYQSLAYVWAKQIAKPVMEEPDGYSEAAITGIVEKYIKRAEEINQTRNQILEDETIIFVLSESLSDPTRVDGVSLTENVLENILALKEKTTSGLMRADNYGGGTANMETQSLVGLPLYNLSAYIYNVEIIPKLSVLPAISDRFLPENKYVIHLGGTQIYSRADVYKRLKFETFIADDANATPPTMNVKYGGFPSDASTYQNILDHLNPDENQFFSVITYQNHVPWSMSEPEEIRGQGDGFTDKENERLSHYARLLYQTDIDTKEFLEKLSDIDKKVTVVFYGDHLPGFYPESAFKENPESQYLTDYFIWSNSDKEKKNYPLINSSDFPAALLGHTNSKVSPYYALLTDVLERASVGVSEWTPAQEEIANELKLVQYDLISGKSYLSKRLEFFEFMD